MTKTVRIYFPETHCEATAEVLVGPVTGPFGALAQIVMTTDRLTGYPDAYSTYVVSGADKRAYEVCWSGNVHSSIEAARNFATSLSAKWVRA
jgi:hypothetical protein